MNKDKLILAGLIGASIVVGIHSIKLRIDTAYIKGKNDQMEKDTEYIEKSTKELENIRKKLGG